jgi:hypothetical protein
MSTIYPKSTKSKIFEFIIKSIPSLMAIIISIYSVIRNDDSQKVNDDITRMSKEIREIREEEKKTKEDILVTYNYIDGYLHQSSQITLPTNFPPTHIGATAYILSVDSKKFAHLFKDEFSIKQTSGIIVIVPTAPAPRMPDIWSKTSGMLRVPKLD